MGSLLSKALGALLNEHSELVAHAVTLANLAAWRWHECRESRNLATDKTEFMYTISFDSEEDLRAFSNSVRGLVEEVAGK